jgi:hypothetical protein
MAKPDTVFQLNSWFTMMPYAVAQHSAGSAMDQHLATPETSANASLASTISHVRQELERAVKFDSVKAIHDQAEALRLYAKSIGAAQSALNSIAEIKIRAERRMGREIASLTLNAGGRPAKSGDRGSPVSSAPTLAELGIHKKWSQRWQALARMPTADFEDYLYAVKKGGEELTAAGVYRAARKIEKAAASPAAGALGLADVRRQLRALERAWGGASDAARRAFIDKHLGGIAIPPGDDSKVVLLTTMAG